MNAFLDTPTAEEIALKDSLKRGAILAYRLVNTIYSSSFLNSLERPIKITDAYQCEASKLMESRIVYQIKHTVKHRTNESSHADMVKYLDHMATKLDLGLKACDKKGMIKHLSAIDSDEVQQYVYKMAAILSEFRYEYRQDVHSFNCHEVLYELRSFLVARTTLINGIAHRGLHDQFMEQLAKRPAAYFGSYTGDLFDYAQRMVLSNSRVFVAWHREWLSIDCFFDKKDYQRDCSERDVYLATS